MREHERAFYEYMSDLSEDYWAAGWVEGWEYTAWEKYRLRSFQDHEIATIKMFVKKTGGWPVYEGWNEVTRETKFQIVPIGVFWNMYREWAKKMEKARLERWWNSAEFKGIVGSEPKAEEGPVSQDGGS